MHVEQTFYQKISKPLKQVHDDIPYISDYWAILNALSRTQPANIGPQDVPRTSPTNVPRTSPKGPI